ncbi:MAG TPA: hypothetical protein VFY92_05440 [Hyphomicrobiaceae bacterium]|nr:hypothetical protein [Hyphomicrobiaceae bacterium]
MPTPTEPSVKGTNSARAGSVPGCKVLATLTPLASSTPQARPQLHQRVPMVLSRQEQRLLSLDLPAAISWGPWASIGGGALLLIAAWIAGSQREEP